MPDSDEPLDSTEELLHSIRRSLVVLSLIAFFVTCYFARDLLLPVLLGFLIALTLSPLTRGLGRIGVPHWVSGVGLIAILTTVSGIVVYFGSGIVGDWMQNLPSMGRELQNKLAGIFQQIETVRQAGEDVAQMTGQGAADAPAEVVVQQPTLFNTALDAMSTTGTTVAVALVLAVFLLASGDLFYIKLVQSFDTMTGKKRALSAIYDIERKVSHYLLTITVINACLGAAVALWLTLLGLPYGWLFGIAAFLLNFLPYLGAMIGVVLVAASAILNFDQIGYALLCPLGYFAMTTIEGNFITPTALGRSLKMNTVAVFLTVVLWAWLWGVPGALVAVPFLVVFKVIADHVDRLKIVGNFLGGADGDERSALSRAEVRLDAPAPGTAAGD